MGKGKWNASVQIQSIKIGGGKWNMRQIPRHCSGCGIFLSRLRRRWSEFGVCKKSREIEWQVRGVE